MWKIRKISGTYGKNDVSFCAVYFQTKESESALKRISIRVSKSPTINLSLHPARLAVKKSGHFCGDCLKFHSDLPCFVTVQTHGAVLSVAKVRDPLRVSTPQESGLIWS